jgi:hypothetical protein
MPLRQLARPSWQGYFDHVSKTLGAQRVEIEVTGVGLGDQVAADWIPLTGLSYDPKDDLLIVFCDGLQHQIQHPHRIDIDREFDWLHSIDAVDAEGNHHIVRLKEPLALTETA